MAQNKHNEKHENQLGHLMNTSYFVVKEGMVLERYFRKYLRICALQQKNRLDLGQNYLSDIACSRFVSSVAEDIKSDLKSDVEDARFLSVLSGRSTNAGILEEKIVYIRYLKENAPVTKFAGIKNP